MSELTHLNKKGEAVMVDVGSKDITLRCAEAVAEVCMGEETLKRILVSELKKGDA